MHESCDRKEIQVDHDGNKSREPNQARQLGEKDTRGVRRGLTSYEEKGWAQENNEDNTQWETKDRKELGDTSERILRHESKQDENSLRKAQGMRTW